MNKQLIAALLVLTGCAEELSSTTDETATESAPTETASDSGSSSSSSSSSGGSSGGSSSSSSGGGSSSPAPETPAVDYSIKINSPTPASVELYATPGQAIPLSFSVSNPSGATTKCYWSRITPVQANWPTETITRFGNGLCNGYTHNQTNQLNSSLIVTANNGTNFDTFRWNITYTSNVVNNGVSVSATTTAGVVRVYQSKEFQVEITDRDGDGSCTWKLDNVLVSTNCAKYTYTADNANHALDFRISDGVNQATASWTIKPGAKLTSVTPTTSSQAVGASQTYTAVISDPNSSGAICEWKKNGALAQARGSCSYTYTRADSAVQTIVVDAVYDSNGTERTGVPLTAYANPPANNSVAMTGFTPAIGQVYYYETGATTGTFGVTSYTDPDGDAWFDWGMNCDTSPFCTYTNAGLQNGIQLDNYSGLRMNLKVKLTDGQYTAEQTWVISNARSKIDESVPAGGRCNQSGTTFPVWGVGFEGTDTFKLTSSNVTLQVVSLNYNYVVLKLPANVSSGSPGISVTKAATGITTSTNALFVTFSTTNCQ